MIIENSIYLAPVIMFRRDENGIPSFYYYEEKYIVTDYDKYIDINTHEEYEHMQNVSKPKENTKYIMGLHHLDHVDIETYTKALIAFNSYLNKLEKENKTLELKQNKSRD